ncbi:MAG: hypothetical protein ACJ8BW_03545, partial [Ktedonobacteraceae bacterium]
KREFAELYKDVLYKVANKIGGATGTPDVFGAILGADTIFTAKRLYCPHQVGSSALVVLLLNTVRKPSRRVDAKA